MTTNISPPYEQRYGEASTEDKEFLRSGRFFCQGDKWFFKTREGIDYGPYKSKTECRYAYTEFIEIVSHHNELGGIAVDFKDTDGNWKVPKISFS